MKTFSVILSFCLIIVMSSCSSVMVKTDIHNQKDFEKYTTYNWVDVEGNTANLEMDRQTREEIEDVMAAKGFIKDDQNEPDLLIDFDYETRYQIDVIPYYNECEPFSFYLQGNSDFKYWPNGRWDGKGKVFMYEDKILKINFSQKESEEVVWSGLAAMNVTYQENEEEIINEMVTKVLEKLPGKPIGNLGLNFQK